MAKEGTSSNVDKSKSQRRGFELATTSQESFNTIMNSLRSTSNAKKGLQALKSKKTGKPRQGLFSKLFNQETGIASAPLRFTTALVADTLGYKDEEGKLAEQAPLESAVRSAMGNFAITGGDIFKVNDDDSFSERLAKYAGALSIDIVADPLNWFGGIGTFSRKGIAVNAVRNGSTMLDDATKILVKSGSDGSALIDDLFLRSRLTTAARNQAAGTFTTAELNLLDEISKALPEAKKLAEKGTPLDLVKLTESGTIDPAFKLKIAGFEFGNAVGEAFYRSGRPGVRKFAKSIFKEEAAVDEFMRTLSPELAGGFFLKTPTGKPIARIAGGLGKGGKVSQALNDLRFAVAASAPVRFIPAQFSGKTGVSFAAVKKGLVDPKLLDSVSRTKLLDYVSFRDAIRQRNADLTRMGIKAKAVISGALAITRGVTDTAAKEEYDAAFRNFFFNPKSAVNVDSEAAKLGAGAATDLREAIKAAHDEAKALGIDVGDLGEDWVMLRLTDEEYKKIAEFDYLRGGVDAVNVYRPEKHRTKWAEIHPDPAVRNEIGYDAPNRPGVVLLSAPVVNQRLGRKVYEDDPIKLATDYLTWITSTISAKRFVDAASATGAILRFPAETRKIVSSLDAQGFMNAAAKLAPSARAKANAILEARRAQLREAVSEDTLRKVQVDISAEKNTALGEYALAKDAEITARNALREADAAVAAAEPSLLAAVSRIRQYAKSGSEQVLDATRRLLLNATSRRSRASAAQEAAIAEAQALTLRAERRGVTQGILDERAALQQDVSRLGTKLEEEGATIASLRDELDAAKIVADDLSRSLGAEQLADFNKYQLALRRQEAAAVALQEAKAARVTALNRYRAALEDTTLARVEAVDTVVNGYVEKAIAYREAKLVRGARTLKSMTEQERIAFETAKAEYNAARKEMFEILGYSTRKNAPGVGRQYANKIVELAEMLTKDEVALTRVIANSQRLETLVRSFDGMQRETALGIVGDVFQTYARLREFINPEDFEQLSKLERSLLKNSKMKDLTEVVQEVPFGAQALMDEAKKAGVEEEFGIRRLGAGVTKVDVSLPRSMRDVYAPEGIRSVLESMYRLQRDPNPWQEFVAKLYDPLSLVWKTAVTVGRGPAYTVTNTVGGLANNYLGGVSIKSHKVSAVVFYNAVNTIRNLSKDPANLTKSYFELVQLAEKKLRSELAGVVINKRPAIDLFVEFLERGGHFSSDIFFQADELSRVGINMATPLERRSGIQYQFAGEPKNVADNAYRKTVTYLLNNPLQRRFNDLAASSEIFMRFAAFVEGFQRYGNVDSAMDLMYMLHFDYQDLSDAEMVIKRFVPFYTWMRNNVPLQLRMAFLQTGKVSNLFKVTEEAKQAFGVEEDMQWLNDYLPDYMDINNGFISYMKFGDNHLALFPKLPINDVDQLLAVGYVGSIPVILPRRDQIINATGPVVRTPMEFFTNRNFQYGYEYDSVEEMLAKQVETLVPYTGTISRAVSGLSLGKIPVENTPILDFSAQKGKGVSNLLQFLFGSPFGATMYGERTLKGVAYGRSKELNKELQKAAADANVDIDWLRDQIKKGRSAEQLAQMIERGEGDIERNARRRRIEELTNPKKKRGKDYSNVLKELRGK